jgi:ABC-2 type transport system ATP-binding protein
MSANTVIDVNGVTVKYGSLTAVDNVSFEVKDGEIFGIIGPNGAGKTSLIECLEGLRTSYSGRASVLGIDPSDRKKLYRHIGVQLQEASFPDNIKVGELCRLFSSFYENPADYNGLLERFSLADKLRSHVKKLSGGQRQKVSIVTALIANPRVVFLDELTTGLDPQSRIGMWELVKSLREEGKTIVMTTHFMDEAEYLCDRVCMMMDGSISAIGTVDELVAQAQLDQKITFLCRFDGITDGLLGLASVSEVSLRDDTVTVYGGGGNFLRDVVTHLAEFDIDYDNLSFKKPGLEDVFLKLTGFEMEEIA